tara:strand:- start:16796 stop:18121 length:1326 start_codon:yes stop_codon:yes gene_type:complete
MLLVSCGKGILESNSAPKTNDQLGVIASCTTRSQATAIAKETGTMFRVINEKRGLIEFIGLSESELKDLLPKSKFKANKIYEDILIETSEEFSAKNIPNTQFYGAHSPEYRHSGVGRFFPHLDQIGALSSNQHLGAGITIAVIDTGVYYNHPHLSPNIKTNESDRHGNQGNYFDDDGNGFTDDYVGWDFYNGDAYPIDDNGHGTHVAGLAASTYMGVAPMAKILPVKVLSSRGSGDLGTITAGILYAIDMDADIINLSLGGPGSSNISSEIAELVNSVKLAKANNALVVSAAGNGGSDGLGDCNDANPIYPANINEDNMLTVASVDAYNELTSYSNFGEESVHIAAPGGDQNTGALNSTAIAYCSGRCTQNDVAYVGMSGTSMATPIVSGLAAVVLAAKPELTPKEVKEIIINNGIAFENLEGVVQSGKVINAQNIFHQFF